MAHVPPSTKTLKQYCKDRKFERFQPKGVDFEDYSLAEPLHEAEAEESLWRAVILQMITDALSNSQKTDNMRARRDAIHWLTRHSRDFRMVSQYAGYDPDWLQAQINLFLAPHLSGPLPLTALRGSPSIQPTLSTNTPIISCGAHSEAVQ